MKTRAELKVMLDRLQSELPQLLADNGPNLMWDKLHMKMDAIWAGAAVSADSRYVKLRIATMLAERGMVPPDGWSGRR